MPIFLSRFKIQFRIKVYYALIPVVLFLLFGSTFGVPETFLSLTGYVTQSLIFMGMLLGYHGGLRDKKQAGEYLYILPHSYESQFFSVLSEWCFIIFLHIFLYAYICGCGLLYRQESWYYKETFFYVILYYLLPMLLGDVIGRVCSIFGGKPVWYFVLLLAGLCIGPMAHPFLEMLCGHILGDAVGGSIADFLNIGQIDIGYGMDLFYGLQIESRRYAHTAFLLFTALDVWSLFLRLQIKVRKERKAPGKFLIILCSTAAVFSLAVYTRPGYVTSSEESFNDFAINQYDLNYYSNQSMRDEEGMFRIDRISGTVDTRRYLSFSGMVEGEILSDTDILSFRLYHDLRVKEISGEKISGFKQDGDTVKIFLEKGKEGNPINFFLCYEGTSSPYFYSNERAVFLPAYFNWLPCPGEGSAMRIEQKKGGAKILYPNPVFMKNEVLYDLIYIGSYEPYTNLAKDSDGHFRGLSGEGVYLLSNGHMRTYSYGVGEIVSCIPLPDDFARVAGKYLAEQVRRLQTGQESKSYRILLIPHHVSGNTASFEYAGADTIYADVETWNYIRDYTHENMEEALKRSAEYAVRQFETN